MTKKRHSDNVPEGFDPIPWVAGALFVLGIAVLTGMYWKRTVVVKEVRFGGNYFVSTEQLDQQVDIPAGIPPDSLDFIKIIGQIEKIPYVKRAFINVEPSGNLLIEVREREPIALLANGEDKIYVDEDGMRLPIILGKAVNVPILYGFKTRPMTDTLKSKAWQQTQAFLIELHNNPIGNATISEVAWTENKGIVALTHGNDVKLVFGKDKFKSRLNNWKAFFSEIIPKKRIQKMQWVDLRFEGQIVTREN